MKKIAIGLLAINAFFLTACDAQGLKTPQVKVSVEVIEEDGTPISAAKASCSGGLGTPGKRQADGFTTPDGCFTATIASSEGMVKASAEKRGYYHNGTDYQSVITASADQSQPYRKGKWSDDETVIKIILSPIKNPVPMYAKQVVSDLPVRETWVGYDLAAGDWIVPYGKGSVSDFEFYSEGNVESNIEYNGRLKMRVPGRGNGIQLLDLETGVQYCQFKSPYEAPENGYNEEWSWRNIRTTKGREFSEITDESNPNRIFMFRIRAETDDWGRVTRAQYGKIYGPFHFGIRSNSIGMTYYLNPDYTRNLEFDPKQNLFPQETGKGREYQP